MLAFFPFTGINEILPSLMGVLGLLMTWELHDLGIRAGRIQGLDISDPSVVRTLLRSALFRRGERHLAAQYEVTRVLAESSTMQEAGPGILKAIGESLDSELGIFWSVDEQQGVLHAVDRWHASNVQTTEFVAGCRQPSLGRSIGLPGRVWSSAAPGWTHDIVEDVDFPRGPFAAKAGSYGAFAFPVRNGAHIYGVIELFSRAMREPDGNVLNMVDEIGVKIGQFLHREQTELTLRQTEEKLIEEAKLVEVARMVANIGHDLKNFLTPILLGASHVKSELEECESKLYQLDPKETRATLVQSKEVLTMVLTGAHRMHDRVREISDSVKGLSSPPQFSQCRVGDVVADVFETLRLLAGQQGVVLRAEEIDRLPLIMADESRLFNALHNLVCNAIPEVPRDGSVTIHGRTNFKAKAVILSVADTGRGMPSEVVDSLFTYRAHSLKQEARTTFYLTLPFEKPKTPLP